MNKIETTTYFTFDEVKHLPNNLKFVAEDDVFVHCKITMDEIAKKLILGSPENVEYIISVCDKDLNHYQIFNLKKTDLLEDVIKIDAKRVGEKLVFNLYSYEYRSKEDSLASKINDIQAKEAII
jgi:hypothetical protein